MPSWKKQSRIFHLDESPNRSTHTQVPTVWVTDNVVRLYYACRNNGKSFIAFIDLDRKDLTKVVRVNDKPVMDLGKPGMFDAHGTMPSCVIEKDGELWLYYIGWNEIAEGARYQNEIGLAVSKDGGETFERKFQGPIMGRSPIEPGLAVMPFVMYENWYRMWYQSLTSWELIDDVYEPVYVIKYAESLDGVEWKRYPEQCVPSNYPLEAFSRPAVYKKDGIYHMYYCIRRSDDYREGSGSYRIGYSYSTDGINFTRADDCAGIDIGNVGEFDSRMQCYPAISEIDGSLYIFYNGNGFGQTGIGLAAYEY